MGVEAMRETLREWWWAWRWVVKNFRQIGEQYPIHSPNRFALPALASMGGLIVGILISIFKIPFPFSLIPVFVFLFLIITIPITLDKLDLDWFNQRYEIRKKRREEELK